MKTILFCIRHSHILMVLWFKIHQKELAIFKKKNKSQKIYIIQAAECHWYSHYITLTSCSVMLLMHNMGVPGKLRGALNVFLNIHDKWGILFRRLYHLTGLLHFEFLYSRFRPISFFLKPYALYFIELFLSCWRIRKNL